MITKKGREAQRQPARPVNQLDPRLGAGPPVAPVSSVGIVFRTRRDLLRVTVGPEVLADSQLPIELANILVDLHGAINLHWPDPEAHNGHVTFRDLLETSVHDDTFSDATLSLRLKRLQQKGLLVVEKIPESGPGAELRSRGDRTWVSITPAGVEIASSIWDRYHRMSERLLEGAPQADAQAHYRFSAFISRRTKQPSISYEEAVRDADKALGSGSVPVQAHRSLSRPPLMKP